MTASKKPWRKVGKLEARIKHLEDVVEQRHKHYCMDYEELTKKFSNECKQIRTELDREIALKEQILKEIRAAIDKILKGK